MVQLNLAPGRSVSLYQIVLQAVFLSSQMGFLIRLSIHYFSINPQHVIDSETGGDGFNVTIKPFRIVFVAHLQDQVMYHYRGIV